MKSRSNIFFVLAVAGLLATCSDDFLDRPPLSNISSENFYQTTEELRLATAALYSGTPWADWNYNCYLPIGEVLSGNMAVGYWGDAVQLHTFSVTSLNGIMISNWKSMYNIIAHCNVTINAIQERTPASVPEIDKNAAIAEARFIRGFAYYNLAMLWREVPIIEDNRELIYSPQVPRNTANNVFQFAVNDLTFAAQHLPATDTKGRLTKWSAHGMLAKVYLAFSGLSANGAGPRDEALLDSAERHAGIVCKESGLELMENYDDLFKTANNDNPESLFALQWVPETDEWLNGNMLQIYYTGGPEISANGESGWFQIQPTVNIHKLYSVKDSIRRKATFMLRDDYYPDLNAAGGGYIYNGDAGLKKHIVGTYKDNNAPTMTRQSSPEHNALLRLADVYLVYAEAIMGNNAETSDQDAVFYFNEVRRRAGLGELNPVRADSLFKERRIELAAEGHFWNDLVRLSFYNEQAAIDTLNNQQRVPFNYSNGVATPREPYGTITPATKETFRFPLPSSEVTANPKLLEEAVPYF